MEKTIKVSSYVKLVSKNIDTGHVKYEGAGFIKKSGQNLNNSTLAGSTLPNLI